MKSWMLGFGGHKGTLFRNQGCGSGRFQKVNIILQYNHVINVTLCARSGSTTSQLGMYQVSGFRCRPELRSSHWMFGSKKWSFLFPRTDVEVLMTSPWKSGCWCVLHLFWFFFLQLFYPSTFLHHFAMFSIHHLEFTHDWICIRQVQDKNHHGFHHWRRDFSGQLRWVLSTSSPCWEWWWTWSATFWMKLSQEM